MSPKSILITDDEKGIRLMLRTALESDGFRISEAVDGQDALDFISRETPDLLVLDLNMPRIDGMAVLEQLNTLPAARRPRVIILTAFGSISAAVKATRLGALDFLEKPITPEDLRQTVCSVLNESRWDGPHPGVETAERYDDAIRQARRALQSADWDSAESMLMKAADRNVRNSAHYFNLLGILYESQQKWRLARKCYGKAMNTDKKYKPAEVNMRRLFELYTFGRSEQPVMFGEADQRAEDGMSPVPALPG
jgi:DNA-binding response OmpR family regulator